jgi:hypothetical protein
MAHLTIVRPTRAPKEVQAVYEEFYKRMSFPSPPNFIMTQGHSPQWHGERGVVRNVLVSGEIPRWMKEMMFVAISRTASVAIAQRRTSLAAACWGRIPETLNQSSP